MLPLLLQKSFSRPSWTVDFLALSLNIATVGNNSQEVVPIFEKPETWPV